MIEQRLNPRYRTMGHARITGEISGELLLKDISITGCCLECTTICDIIQDKKYKIVILPEIAANIETFEIEAECRWIRSADYVTELGFLVVASPRGKGFQRYVDYLEYHSGK
ncbi:MAG: PilZ domain-containing protein [Treponema sp.]|jgi:hypothetical protein|nr:PilZ domain-containing protein [Treponema sp.]